MIFYDFTYQPHNRRGVAIIFKGVQLTKDHAIHTNHGEPDKYYVICYYPCGHFCTQPNLTSCCVCDAHEYGTYHTLCPMHAELWAAGILHLDGQVELRDGVRIRGLERYQEEIAQ